MTAGRRRFGLLWLIWRRRGPAPTRATVLPGQSLEQATSGDDGPRARMVADLAPPRDTRPRLPRWQPEAGADGSPDRPGSKPGDDGDR